MILLFLLFPFPKSAKAIKDGSVSSNFKGVALGDSWISPMDSVNTWGPFMYAMVRDFIQIYVCQAV